LLVTLLVAATLFLVALQQVLLSGYLLLSFLYLNMLFQLWSVGHHALLVSAMLSLCGVLLVSSLVLRSSAHHLSVTSVSVIASISSNVSLIALSLEFVITTISLVLLVSLSLVHGSTFFFPMILFSLIWSSTQHTFIRVSSYQHVAGAHPVMECQEIAASDVFSSALNLSWWSSSLTCRSITSKFKVSGCIGYSRIVCIVNLILSFQ
jgi:hypothetical protein